MAAIIWTDVTNHVAGLSAIAVAAQNDILAHVNSALNVTVFGGEASGKLKMARIYLAAHFATLANLGASGAAGPVTQTKLGDAAIGYSSPSTTSNSQYASTAYGQMYLVLLKTTGARGMVV